VNTPTRSYTTPHDLTVDRQIEVIRKDWDEVSDLASLTRVDRGFFWKRQFLNPYAFYGYRVPA